MNRRLWMIAIFILIVLVYVYWCMTIDVFASEPTPEPAEEPMTEPTEEPTPEPSIAPTPSPTPTESPAGASEANSSDPGSTDISVLEEIRDTQYYMLYGIAAILAVLLITIFATGIDRR